MAAQPNQKSGHAGPLGGDGKPPRRGKVEGAWVAPYLADHAGERAASQPLLHCPQGIACVARLDVDEVLAGKARRIDPAALQNRHPLLHPQQRLGRIDLSQQQPRPAGVAGVGREQFGKSRHSSEHARKRRIDRSGAREDGSAGDEREVSCHTTHNVSVLLLFLSRDSPAGVNGATRPTP